MKRPNLRIISIEESGDLHLKGTINIFNKLIEENFPNLKKEMPMNIQETYRTPKQEIQEIQDTMKRPNLRIICIDESADLHLQGPAHIFNKIMEENFPNQKRELLMNIQEAYRTPN